MKLTIISFSGREGGNCNAIARQIEKQFESEEVHIYCFSQLSLTPCGKCQYECFNERLNCLFVEDKTYEMYDSITNSDLAIFIVPNYCDYPNANYFTFNERSQCYFQGHEELLEQYERVSKKFVVVSNTGKDNFISAFQYQTNKEPDILFLSAKNYGRVSIKGDLMECEEAREDLNLFLNN